MSARSLLVRGAVVLALGAAGLVGAASPAPAAARPTVTSVSPATGPLAGGTRVTIRGTGFTAATKVLFGSTRASQVSVRSATKLVVTSPPRSSARTVDVKVKVAARTSTVSRRSAFRYLPNATVSTSGYTSCMVRADSRGFCWGDNVFGQVGVGAAGDSELSPRRVPGRWRTITVRDSKTCGIRVDGSGYCWGLSVGAAPVQAPGSWRVLEPGGYLQCGIKTNGSLWCWGRNDQGQVGIGSTEEWIDAPTRVGEAGWRWKNVSNASDHACAVRSDGQAFCWGNDANAVIGNPEVDTDVNVPYAVGSGFSRVETGFLTSCGVAAGTAYCWGHNNVAQTGSGGPSTPVQTPVEVSGGASWKRVAVTTYSTCGLQQDGSGWCWGDGAFGALGAGPGVLLSNVPVAVAGTQDWASLDLGLFTACGVKANGRLLCWGDNSVGSVGDGVPGNRLRPTTLPGRWTSVSVTDLTACAVRTDNSVWCWGRNRFEGPPVFVTGAVGSGSVQNELTPHRLAGT